MDEKITDSVSIENVETEKKENEIKAIDHGKEKKRSKEEKAKRKDEKRFADQFLKSLNDVHSVEDKLELMCRKYSETVDENRKLQLTLKQSEKKMLMLQREKEQLQSERSKAVLTRRRLESLCRELQKQNKAVKEESLLKIREQEEMRKELAEKFQNGLAQITALMNQNIEKNAKMYEENLEMNKKFKSVYEQVELKEQQLLKVHQQMKLDLQLADAKLAKVKMEATAEKEALLKEKQQLLFKLTEYQVQIRELQATEVGLRSQISMYTDKYDEFQNALTRSNKVYGEFNEEMEKMSKKILTLEKETSLWKQRWENSHASLLEMAADKQIRDSEMATLSKKLALLQDLCKMFQCERTNLIAQLKKKDKSPTAETTAQTNTHENAKVIKQAEELSKDCANLQNSFGQLQSSISETDMLCQNLIESSSEKASAESKSHLEEASNENKSESKSESEDQSDRLQLDETNRDQELNAEVNLEIKEINDELTKGIAQFDDLNKEIGAAIAGITGVNENVDDEKCSRSCVEELINEVPKEQNLLESSELKISEEQLNITDTEVSSISATATQENSSLESEPELASIELNNKDLTPEEDKGLTDVPNEKDLQESCALDTKTEVVNTESSGEVKLIDECINDSISEKDKLIISEVNTSEGTESSGLESDMKMNTDESNTQISADKEIDNNTENKCNGEIQTVPQPTIDETSNLNCENSIEAGSKVPNNITDQSMEISNDKPTCTVECDVLLNNETPESTITKETINENNVQASEPVVQEESVSKAEVTEINSTSVKGDATETRINKAGPVKNGKRRRK